MPKEVAAAVYQTVKSGEISGSATAKQLPDIACKMVMLTARAANDTYIYLGGEGVTAPNGTQNATTGFELKASATTPWITVDNLNRLYLICLNALDSLLYLAVT